MGNAVEAPTEVEGEGGPFFSPEGSAEELKAEILDPNEVGFDEGEGDFLDGINGIMGKLTEITAGIKGWERPDRFPRSVPVPDEGGFDVLMLMDWL